jgi:hypothetical protein
MSIGEMVKNNGFIQISILFINIQNSFCYNTLSEHYENKTILTKGYGKRKVLWNLNSYNLPVC